MRKTHPTVPTSLNLSLVYAATRKFHVINRVGTQTVPTLRSSVRGTHPTVPASLNLSLLYAATRKFHVINRVGTKSRFLKNKKRAHPT